MFKTNIKYPYNNCSVKPGSHYRTFKILTDFEIWLQLTLKENLCRFSSLKS